MKEEEEPSKGGSDYFARHFINTILNHCLHNSLFPRATKMGTEAQGGEVTCTQSCLKSDPSDSSTGDF